MIANDVCVRCEVAADGLPTWCVIRLFPDGRDWYIVQSYHTSDHPDARELAEEFANNYVPPSN